MLLSLKVKKNDNENGGFELVSWAASVHIPAFPLNTLGKFCHLSKSQFSFYKMNKNNDYRSRLLGGLIMLRIFSKLGLIVSVNPQPLCRRIPDHLVADVCMHLCTSPSVTYYSVKVVYDIDDQA